MPPALPDLPDRFETGRLLVRAPQPGDGYAVYAAVLESLPALRAWPSALPWALQEPSPAESVAFCCDGYCRYQARTDMPMLIFRKEDNCLIGATGLHSLDWQQRHCEVGYWGRSACLGQGYFTEAVQGITQFALQRLHMRRIECLVDTANLPSRKVAERAGFRLEGIRRDDRSAPAGTPRDTCVYVVNP